MIEAHVGTYEVRPLSVPPASFTALEEDVPISLLEVERIPVYVITDLGRG